VLVATGGTEDLASATVTLLLFAFIFVNVAVLVLRREAVDHEHFRVPRALPVLAVLTSVGLLTQRDGEDFLRAAAFLVLGLVLWLVNRRAGEVEPAGASGTGGSPGATNLQQE
jgi:amino acid transporter